MMLSSWIPCGTVLRETELARIRCDGLYFAELFRRGGYLAQLCQASVYEGVREDVYVGCVRCHSDCLWQGKLAARTADTEGG